jgi:D-beta-D-heptose 7-phosphate kinase/D-beta-D-heptose 1-phosphate adenosyltransferase
MSIGAERAQDKLNACQGKKVLVVGDAMLDCYIQGQVDRISPEAPVPVVQVVQERQVPGGASNVALNLATLGCEPALCACVGEDAHGRSLQTLLEAHRVDCNHLITLEGRQTTVKSRVVADRQQIVRVDWDDLRPLHPEEVDRIRGEIGKAMDQSDAVILEDYGKGLMTQDVLEAVCTLAAEKGIPVGLDPKEGHHLILRHLTVVTPNRKEAFAAAGVPETSPVDPPLEDESLLNVADQLRQEWGSEMLLITLGAQGMLLVQEVGDPLHIPTLAREVFDVSGAGDTVIGVFIACLAGGASPEEAAQVANAAAGVVVSKLGTATVRCDEILDVLS